MTSYVLDLSNAPGERNVLADRELPADQSGDGVQILNVARSHLISLETIPGSLLHDIARTVTTLQAPFNNLSSLAGIEHFISLEVLNLSHNNFTAIDANMAALLHRLDYLQVIDLSHNKLRLLDLEIPSTKSVPVGGASAVNRSPVVVDEDHTMNVTSLNLSHNALIELPDLRVMPALQVLNLDYNKIEDIADADAKLPLLAIHTLQIRENRLPVASSAMPLAVLAATVRHLQIYGNPFTLPFNEEEVQLNAQVARGNRATTSADSRRGSTHPLGKRSGSAWWWRPYLLWLLPLLQTLDAAAFTPSERSVAASLFRDRGALSKNYIELLNSNRKDDLDSYLHKQCERATAPVEILDTVLNLQEEDRDDEVSDLQTPVKAAVANGHAKNRADSVAEPFEPLKKSEWLPPPLTEGNAHASQAPRQVRGPSTGRGAGGAPPNANEVLAAIQRKLRSLSDVVETLWRYDRARRVFAAVTIQKWYRGYAARRDLPEDVQEASRFIRLQLQSAAAAVGSGVGAAGGVGGSGSRGAPGRASVSRASGEMAKATAPVVPTGNQAADILEVLSTMKGLQAVMTTMWEDLDEYRAMAERERRRAAVTIQRNYRGYRGRKEWLRLKGGYDEFVDSLEPFVKVLQRVGRGYHAREKLRADADGKYVVQRLRSEVSELREELRELWELMGLPAKMRDGGRRGVAVAASAAAAAAITVGPKPQLAHFAGNYDSGLDADDNDGGVNQLKQRRGGSGSAVECSQSATASVLDSYYRAEDDLYGSAQDTPLRGVGAPAPNEYSTEDVGESKQAPAVIIYHHKPQGTAPLQPGGAAEEVGSDGESRRRRSDVRIVKRRPSRDSSLEGSPNAMSRKVSGSGGDKGPARSLDEEAE